MATKKDATKDAKKSDAGSSSKGKAAASSSSGGGSGDAKKRLTQTEIVKHLAEKANIKQPQVKEFMNELANLAMSEVKRSGEFTLPGFGKLVLSERKEREGRNPATGAKITIPAKTTLKFRLGKGMKDGAVGDDGK